MLGRRTGAWKVDTENKENKMVYFEGAENFSQKVVSSLS